MSKNKADLPGADLLFGTHAKQSSEVKQTIAPEVEEKLSGVAQEFKITKVDDTEPVKFTFYFSPQLLEDLEVAKFRLRMEKRLKISKSDIVNSALTFCLKDMTFLERLVKGEIK